MGLSPSHLIDFYYAACASTFTQQENAGGYALKMSELVEGMHTNHIFIRRGDPDDVLGEVGEFFEKHKEHPVFYVTPLCECADAFDGEGWKQEGCDVWMTRTLADAHEPALEAGELIIEEVDPAEPEEYLQTFIDAFSDPNDVYGEIPEGYVTSERNSFSDEYDFDNLILLCRKEGKAIGCVRAIIKDELAYLCAFGVLTQFRKGGVAAKLIGEHLLWGLKQKGVTNAFLVTEKGSLLEHGYRLNGFRTQFEGRYISKKN